MANPESKNHKVRITYTDGESLSSIQAVSRQPGSEIITNALGGLGKALGNAVFGQADSDSAYAATKAELGSTSWFRFRRRRKLAKQAAKLYSEALHQAISSIADNLEIIDVENNPNTEA